MAFQAQARSRCIQVTITAETYAEAVTAVCVYCGARPEGKLLGIDRMDSDGIYEDDNIVACCAVCNFMKGTLSVAAFLRRVRVVAAHRAHPALVVAVGGDGGTGVGVGRGGWAGG